MKNKMKVKAICKICGKSTIFKIKTRNQKQVPKSWIDWIKFQLLHYHYKFGHKTFNSLIELEEEKTHNDITHSDIERLCNEGIKIVVVST